ncbi:MAG: hypothetical protein U0838_03480 [Chloroflexota bacterium]
MTDPCTPVYGRFLSSATRVTSRGPTLSGLMKQLSLVALPELGQ